MGRAFSNPPHVVFSNLRLIHRGEGVKAAVLATLWDFVLDPFFSTAGLWKWEGGAVPATNYLGWLATSLAIVALYKPVRPSTWEGVAYAAMTASYVPALLKWGPQCNFGGCNSLCPVDVDTLAYAFRRGENSAF